MKQRKRTALRARCVVCGVRTEGGRLCECCRESLALCDIENYLARKTERKFSAEPGTNAFK